MRSIYNLETLVGIQLHNRVKSNSIEWRPAKRGMFSKREECYVCTDTGECYTQKQLEDGEYNNIKFIVDGSTVYHRPYVAMFFVNSKLDFIKEFDVHTDAQDWGNEQAKLGINIKLIL